jgi:hypothetical protein
LVHVLKNDLQAREFVVRKEAAIHGLRDSGNMGAVTEVLGTSLEFVTCLLGGTIVHKCMTIAVAAAVAAARQQPS